MKSEVRNRTYSEPTKTWFRNFRAGVEMRANADFLKGSQVITYTDGVNGGYFVPQEFFKAITEGMAQFDPLLDPNVCTVDFSDKPGSLRPKQFPAWDLSTISASLLTGGPGGSGEGVQQNPGGGPTLSHVQVPGYLSGQVPTFRCTVDASFEFEEDDFDTFLNQIQRAFSVGFARGMGQYLVIGSGSLQPTGLLTALEANQSASAQIASSQIALDDILNIYFSVNRAYRISPKCAWLMSDKMYQQVRQATDNNGRPLINVVGDQELLLGKPVLVSPSMPNPNPSVQQKVIIFGDLSHYIVRASPMLLRRTIQAPGYVDKGKALYNAIMRADGNLLDPTQGVTPPIVYATGA